MRFLPHFATLALLLGTWLPATPAGAQDRATFGEDIVIARGERATDVITMGGDAIIQGEVLGDVVTMGGDVLVEGEVMGDVVTMGGDVDVSGGVVFGDVVSSGGHLSMSDDAVIHGDRVGSVAFHRPSGFLAQFTDEDDESLFGEVVSMAMKFGLLFLLGLFLIGITRERLGALQVAMVREPVRATALGLLTAVGAVIAAVLLTLTVVGIPAAVVIGVMLPVGMYVGLAAAATVLGAAFPIAALRDKPVLQLAAGVGTLFVASLVPLAGSIALILATALGLGALMMTRFRKDVPSRDRTPAGPYRTSGA